MFLIDPSLRSDRSAALAPDWSCEREWAVDNSACHPAVATNYRHGTLVGEARTCKHTPLFDRAVLVHGTDQDRAA